MTYKSADEFKEWTQGVWTFNGESKKSVGHPAPFPKELPYRCIKLSGYAGDTGRNAVGIELDEAYCELSKTDSHKKRRLSPLMSKLTHLYNPYIIQYIF